MVVVALPSPTVRSLDKFKKVEVAFVEVALVIIKLVMVEDGALLMMPALKVWSAVQILASLRLTPLPLVRQFPSSPRKQPAESCRPATVEVPVISSAEARTPPPKVEVAVPPWSVVVAVPASVPPIVRILDILENVDVALVLVLLVKVTFPSDDKPLTVKEERVPTLVRDELTTEDPKVVASSTRALLMRKKAPVGTFTLPVVKEIPP